MLLVQLLFSSVRHYLFFDTIFVLKVMQFSSEKKNGTMEKIGCTWSISHLTNLIPSDLKFMKYIPFRVWGKLPQGQRTLGLVGGRALGAAYPGQHEMLVSIPKCVWRLLGRSPKQYSKSQIPRAGRVGDFLRTCDSFACLSKSALSFITHSMWDNTVCFATGYLFRYPVA